MTDVLVYWRDYQQNWVRQFAGPRGWHWHSKATVLGELQPGDHLWLVTSGANLDQEAKQAGFLVAIWTVKRAMVNPGDDPAYPVEDYRFRVVADESDSFVLEQPVPVDHILRPHGRDRTISIGRFLQGPRRLKDETLRLMKAAAGPDLALRWLKRKPR
jgi:hypothetical protein